MWSSISEYDVLGRVKLMRGDVFGQHNKCLLLVG